jgi:hypothetical protein
MSMMGPIELSQVEDEVRIIQNGVRTWLLRKNYINLRDAARTLQVAWRGRRHDKLSPRLPHSSRRAASKKNDLETISECVKVTMSPDDRSVEQQLERAVKISDEKAAATLQAATRGMLARKEFHRIKRQTMASLVIQKSLLQWWVQKGSTVWAAAPPSHLQPPQHHFQNPFDLTPGSGLEGG